MPAKKPTEPPPGAIPLARALQDGLRGNEAYALDDVPSERAGIYEPGAQFHVRDGDGRKWLVIVSRQA